MKHTSDDCSFSHKIRTAALIAAPLALAPLAPAAIQSVELNLSGSYWTNSYLQINPWTGGTSTAGSEGTPDHPLAIYYCGADGGSLNQSTDHARWAVSVDVGASDEYSAWGSPTLFAAGDVIGENTSFLTTHTSMYYYAPHYGFYGFGVDADKAQYLGFSYVNGSSIHYGYVEFYVAPNQVYAYDQFFDDPIITLKAAYVNDVAGESITIPGGAAIPEPASAAFLLGLAAIGAGVSRRRRRPDHG